jgi:hypothetical protein
MYKTFLRAGLAGRVVVAWRIDFDERALEEGADFVRLGVRVLCE